MRKEIHAMEGREVHPSPSATEGERWVWRRICTGSISDWRQMKVMDKTLTERKD